MRWGEVWRGRIVPRAMVPNGAGTAKGWWVPSSYPASHPYVSSYLFLLPVYDAPSSAKRRERIGEEENEKETERERKRENEEERWFVNIHYVCAEKRGERRKRRKRRWKTEKKNGSETRDGGNTRVESARGTQEFTATSACKGPAKKKIEKNVPPNQCSRPTELIPAEGFFVASIFSDAISLKCSRESLSRIKARLINQVCRDFSRDEYRAIFHYI